MKNKEKTYIFIYNSYTDGDTVLENIPISKIKARIKKFRLTQYDYAIIDGNILKDFNNKSFDLEKL